MSVTEIVNEIIKENCVEEVSKILLDILIRRNEKGEKDLREARACLQSIHKINKNITKNETIDILSEV